MRMNSDWERCRGRTPKRCITLLVLVGLVMGAGGAAAELQRVEAMGSYGIRESMRTKVIPRDEAVAKARWEGVSRVALELIGEAGPNQVDADPMDPSLSTDPGSREPVLPPIDSPSGSPIDSSLPEGLLGGPSEGEIVALRNALGNDVLPFMRSYRILDDRGEVPVFVRDDPDVAVEYVVIIEVLVDVDRVTEALEVAGLIVGMRSEEVGEAISVELLGLVRFEALEALLEALQGELGATRVQTIEFSRKRQVLLVEGPFGPGALSASLASLDSAELVLEPIGVDSVGRRIRLVGRWFPQLEPAEMDADEDES
ncbi:MAG TPA: hypothetical protein EYQ60_20035 [Myxococcales bacterium]|nr:hypothetical protein [Myxococcales bacterium]